MGANQGEAFIDWACQQERLTFKNAYQNSGGTGFTPSQLYRFKHESQCFPHCGLPIASPAASEPVSLSVKLSAPIIGLTYQDLIASLELGPSHDEKASSPGFAIPDSTKL